MSADQDLTGLLDKYARAYQQRREAEDRMRDLYYDIVNAVHAVAARHAVDAHPLTPDN